MNQTISNFLNALDLEEANFRGSLAADNLGLMLRAAINELDWYAYHMVRTSNPTPEQEEQFYLLQLGVPRLVKLALDVRPSFDVPTVMFRRNQNITSKALRLVAGIAFVEHGRRVAHAATTGECEVELTVDGTYRFTLPDSLPDGEYYERSVREHYRSASEDQFQKKLRSRTGKKLGKEVGRVMRDLVHVFATYFIGYDADPLLDEYFFAMAMHQIQLRDGYDTFHYSTRFGGVPFGKYVLAVTFLIACCIRHQSFAETLVKKHSSIRLEDVLTVSAATDGFLDTMREAINAFGSRYPDYSAADLDEVRRIFDVLSISRRNTGLLAQPASPLPLMVQCSDHDFIWCNTGAASNPMQFLLNSLRHHFPREYDRHQQTREASMQAAIRRVLDEAFAGLTYRDNIKVRVGGRELTDIDLVVMEEKTGVVLLCQLKHQDLYGADLRSAHNRLNRLKDQVSHWLKALDEWTSLAGDSGIRSALRLDRRFPPVRLFRVIVSRHYAFPLKDVAEGADTTYATWPQFYNAVQLATFDAPRSHSLLDLMTALKNGEAPGGVQHHRPEPPTEWNLDNLRFTVGQREGAA